MKEMKIEISGESLIDNKNVPGHLREKCLPETLTLIGRMFIFHNGGSTKIYTIVSENYHYVPQCLEGRENKRSSSPDKYLEMQFDRGFIEFVSLKWLEEELAKEGKISGKKEKKMNDYVKRIIEDAVIIIKDGEFLRGSEEELKKYNMALIKE